MRAAPETSPAYARSDQSRGDAITAAARRKQLDDLVVGHRDNEDGNRRGERQEQAHRHVRPERQEGLLRPVTGGGEAIGPEPDPRQERHQHDVVAGGRIQRIEFLADDQSAQLTRGSP